MLDLAKRQGASAVVGLIEENTDAAPEFARVPVRTINGTTYKTNIRKELPAVQFRKANEGVETSKSEYAQDIVQTYIIDSQLEVDKAIVEADEEGQGAAGILADEASGVMRSLMLMVGTQFYYGEDADEDGFQGLANFVDDSMILDATGSTADTGSSCYGVRFGKQGVSFIAGKKSSLRLGKWTQQQITRDSKKLTALVNNLQGWLGLAFGHTKSVGQIYNLTAQTDKGMTDDRAATLLAQYPVGMKPEVWFMTPRSLEQLRKSRSSVGSVAYAGGAVAPRPTEMHGIPIVETDSLVNTEAIVS
jgi:hypothetical protein